MTRTLAADDQVEAFYDKHSTRLVEDIVKGNERVSHQLAFLAKAIPPSVQTVLVIGFGSGQVAQLIATVAQDASISAIDISSENLRLATAVFSHPRVRYEKRDVVCDPIEGVFETIVLPDVYEHIPSASRERLHSKLCGLLSREGRILITVPSPGHQATLRASGRGLQIIDETVTIDDLLRLARDVGGSLTYFNTISVWQANDYIHAVLERGADRVRPIGGNDQVPLKGWVRRSIWTRAWDSFCKRTRLAHLHSTLKRRRLHKKFSNHNKAAPDSGSRGGGTT